MRRILNDLNIMLLANLWLVPVLAALVGAVFYLVAPPPPMIHSARAPSRAASADLASSGGSAAWRLEKREKRPMLTRNQWATTRTARTLPTLNGPVRANKGM